METLLLQLQGYLSDFLSGELPTGHSYWNYLFLAILVAVEGPIATLIGATAASVGFMRPGLVFLSAAIGNSTSDYLWYYLGYLGKIDWILAHGRWFGLRRDHLDRLQDSMHNNAPKILLVAKLTAGFVIPSLMAAGLAKVPWRKWFPTVLTAEILWTGTLVLIGYYATEAIKTVERGIEYLGIAGSILIVLGVVWMVRKALRKTDVGHELEEDNKD